MEEKNSKRVNKQGDVSKRVAKPQTPKVPVSKTRIEQNVKTQAPQSLKTKTQIPKIEVANKVSNEQLQNKVLKTQSVQNPKTVAIKTKTIATQNPKTVEVKTKTVTTKNLKTQTVKTVEKENGKISSADAKQIRLVKKKGKLVPVETIIKKKSKNNETVFEKEMNLSTGSSQSKRNAWWNKKRNRVAVWINVLLILASIVFVLIAIFSKHIFGTDSEFYKSLGGIANLDEFFFDNSEVILKALINISIILVLQKVIRFVIKFSMSKVRKAKAIVNIIDSIIKYTAMIILVFTLLALFGVDTTTLLAGAGILTLVIGFAAQSLIQDILSGFFIVFEKTFDIDDIVTFNGFRGKITEIGIRTVKMQDAEGNILIVNNSDIRSIINMTKDLSLAICKVSIEYEESIERVEKVILLNIDRIAANVPLIKRGPFYKGVSELGDSGVEIMIVAECLENDRFQVIRDMNREMKLIFDANNINIPFPQIVLNNKLSKVKPVVKKKND